MLTTADKKWITENFATKEDLLFFVTKEEFSEFKEETREFQQETRESLNKIMNTLDHFLGELRDMRQEHDVISHRVYRDHSPKIEDHEKRITRVETLPLPRATV